MTVSSGRRKKSSPPSHNSFSYPLFVDLGGRRCLIVGGGKVAERKCSALVKTGALVTVVSPVLTKRLERYREKGLITHLRRGYRKGDTRAAFLIIAATDSVDTNRKVAEEGAAENKLVNVVDNPALCTFIVPSVVRRGLLTIAISTGGASPALAKTIRKELEGLYGPGLAESLDLIKESRLKAIEEMSDKKERERFLRDLAGEALRFRGDNAGPPESKGRLKK